MLNKYIHRDKVLLTSFKLEIHLNITTTTATINDDDDLFQILIQYNNINNSLHNRFFVR